MLLPMLSGVTVRKCDRTHFLAPLVSSPITSGHDHSGCTRSQSMLSSPHSVGSSVRHRPMDRVHPPARVGTSLLDQGCPRNRERRFGRAWIEAEGTTPIGLPGCRLQRGRQSIRGRTRDSRPPRRDRCHPLAIPRPRYALGPQHGMRGIVAPPLFISVNAASIGQLARMRR